MGLLMLRSSVASGGSPPADPGNLFVADFSAPNANGTMMYNFEDGHEEENWTKTHEATGGPGGTPCVNITWADQGGSFEQVSYGFWTPTLAHTFNSGDSIFFRIIRRYHDAMRWNDGGPQHKIIIFGDGDSRCIVYGNYPSPSVGGSLGWRDSGGGGAFYPHAIPSYFDLVGLEDDWSDAGAIYGSVKVQKNVGIDAAGPALITYGSNAAPPIPGPHSAAPTSGDCWYYEQYEI